MTNATTLTAPSHPTAKDSFVVIGTIPEDEQITIVDTGWTEEEKERMRRAGYDGMDIIQAWYS